MALSTGSIYKSRKPLQIPGRDGLLLSYLLEAANFADSVINGITVHQGEMLTSIQELQDRGGWTEGAVRESIRRLRSNGYISIKATNKGRKRGTLIRIENYRALANINDDEHRTDIEETSENTSTYKQYTKKENNETLDRSTKLYAIPASVNEVVAFALEHGRSKNDAERFFRSHGNGYDGKGERITDWHAYFLKWMPPATYSVDDQLQRLFGTGGDD